MYFFGWEHIQIRLCICEYKSLTYERNLVFVFPFAFFLSLDWLKYPEQLMKDKVICIIIRN